MFQTKRYLVGAAIFVAAVSLAFANGQAQRSSTSLPNKPNTKVTLTVLTANPWALIPKYWNAEWHKQTGGTIQDINVPYSSLREKFFLDIKTNGGAYDLAILPSRWRGDIFGGYDALNLNPYFKKYGYPDWSGVMPPVAKTTMWHGKHYAFPFDGDLHMFYYRKDAFDNPAYQAKFKSEFGYAMPVPPKNWSQVLDLAKFFNGWDWAHTGKKEYGIDFIAQQNTQAQWSLLDLVAQYATTEGPISNYHSNMFFDTSTMKSLADTPGWIKAMTMLKKLAQYGPPGLLGYGYSEERSAFVSGNAAMAFDWEDIGIEAQYPKRYGSTVKGKLGYAPLPGATEYWNRQTNQWVKKQHQVNFLDFGGWFMLIPKDAAHPAAAYKLATFMSTPAHSLANVDGEVGYDGSNQWRKSQFTDVNAWVKQGWTRAGATSFLNNSYKIISDPNAVLDLAIPGAAEYYNSLDSYEAKVLSGEMSPQAGCQNIAQAWNRITNQHGLAKQKAAYRSLLGLQ